MNAIQNFNAHAAADQMVSEIVALGCVVDGVDKSINRNDDCSAYFTARWGKRFATVRVSDHVSHNSTAMINAVGQAGVDRALSFIASKVSA